ncbi:MAG: hypothetical protein H5T76_14375, partial [Streptomyces sp.]|nr:hypothetical protein [Streptomyces sp.]
MVANVGLELLGVPIADLTDEQIDSMVNVNARGALLTMQRAAQNVAERADHSTSRSATAVAGSPAPVPTDTCGPSSGPA